MLEALSVKGLCFLTELPWILQAPALLLFLVFPGKKRDLRSSWHLKRVGNRCFHWDLKNRIPEFHGYFIPSPHLLTYAAILVPGPSPHLLKFNFWLLLKDPPNLCEAMTQKHSLESDVGLTYALKWEAWLYRLGEKEVYSYSANK